MFNFFKVNRLGFYFKKIVNESVKKLKRLWEFQILTSKPNQEINPSKLLKTTSDAKTLGLENRSLKKWLSLEITNKNETIQLNESEYSETKNMFKLNESQNYTSRRASTSNELSPRKRFLIDNAIKSNMLNVLNDIKNLDQSKPLNSSEFQPYAVAKVETEDAATNLENKLVKKLKEKFENKDQAFIKVKKIFKAF